jgi:hypothetical protein
MLKLRGLARLIKWVNISVQLYSLILMSRHDLNLNTQYIKIDNFLYDP